MATKSSVAKKPAAPKSVPETAVVPEAVVLPVSVPAGGGDGREETSSVSVEQLLSALKLASPEQCCALLMELHRGMPLYNERMGESAAPAVAAPKKRGPGRPRKAAAAAAPVAPLPAVAEGDAPGASEYRVPAADIDESVCVGRRFADKDTRWSPHILRERQCCGKVEEGSDLCATCSRREEKYGETGVKSGWAGRITEEPFDETHMLGTAWADKKKPRFLGAEAAPASEGGDADTASTASSATPKPKGKPGRKPMSPEEKAAKEAAKAAAKEAEKAAKAAAKEAEKAAKAAAKEAEKAEKAAAKKAEKAPKAKKEKEPVAAAAGAGAPAAVEGEMRFVDGCPCWLKGTNLYEYDDAAEVVKDYMGQYDGVTLIPDGEEGGAEIVDEAAESDTE
jgi:hypothetical protein